MLKPISLSIKYFFAVAILSILVFSDSSHANDYITRNGYEVELYWKVKHGRTLILWGSIEDGENCKQLKMHIGMKHNEGWYRNFYKNFNKTHSKWSRSPFKVEKKHHSKSLPKKGWYPDRITVTCSDFYRKS